MPDASLEELERRIAAGEYAIDSRKLAGDLLSKMALVRRVARFLTEEGREEGATRGSSAARGRTRGGAPSSPKQPSHPRRERLR